ncbi:hypothetical protein DDQ50_02635 [Amnibacterium flavum]|uniref:Fibronectin type-III domain-containing protein n=1 Tax=Amnibacterium flavum TaxID=2173173 RepID=A0A2V1HS28_9MICO|nr:hypothetical protein DDQ50_02635 [Amnibacterium flavum]
MGAALFALALAAAPVLLPVLPAVPAFAVSAPAEPFVTASTDGIGNVRVEWYTDPGVTQVEIAWRDSRGATDTRTVGAEQGSTSFTGLPAGEWSATVTAISDGARSSSVTVSASIAGDPAPAVTPEAAPVPQAAAPSTAPAATASPVSVAFAVVPREDGAIQGGSARVMASGLQASSPYQVTLRSSSAVLTTGTVGADGAIDATFALPDDIAPGDDALVLTAVGTDGLPVSGEYPITVAAPVVAEPTVPAAPQADTSEPGGLDELLSLRGDEAVPVLLAGTVGATAATGAAVGAASVVNGRLRRLRLSRFIDRDLAGLPPLPKGGFADTVRDVLTVLRGVR